MQCISNTSVRLSPYYCPVKLGKGMTDFDCRNFVRKGNKYVSLKHCLSQASISPGKRGLSGFLASYENFSHPQVTVMGVS